LAGPETSHPESDLNELMEQVVGVVARRRWWILLTAGAISLLVIALTLMLPNRYESTATLVTVQQQVSERYVVPDATTSIAQATAAMTTEILSRTSLLRVIDEFNLYPKERERLVPEALVERMRKDADVEPLDATATAFKVSFSADDPQLAQQVTSRLTSLFVEENLKMRGNQATSTSSFLTEQVETASRKLAQQEQRLQEFKKSNLGELPEQQQANLSVLADLRTQLQISMGNLDRAQQQRESIQASISENLSRLKAERDKLLQRFTSKHPDVVKKDQEIAGVESLLERVKGGGRGTDVPATNLPDDPALAQLRSQAEANSTQIQNLSKEEARLKGQVDLYEGHLNLAPVREQQLEEILRERDLLNKDYTELKNKQLQSNLASNLEERQEGQHFRVVDSASLPVKPSGPKRVEISLGGILGGLFLGFALAYLMERRDSSFHTEKALKMQFKVPLVLSIPLLLSPAEERRQAWRKAGEWVAGCVIVLAVFAAEFYVSYHG
jgi:succinoglycan biosynthesis transport protein ExoP